MKITVARALGTCFGVQDAIDAAMDEAFRDNLTIIGQLVHNPQVVADLLANGVRIVDGPEAQIATQNVMITAHGAPASLKERLRERGHTVFDASCPLVLKVHVKVAQLVRDGYFPVVIGQRNHVEVRGIVGDLVEYDVIAGVEEIDRLAPHPKIGIVCQTTQQVEVARSIADTIRERYPDKTVHFVDTVCKPTKDRQEAVRELADEVDVMIVVGGYNSSNTKKLKKVCDDRGLAAYHIERPEQIDPAWFAGKKHVGITAGTSTPHTVIETVRRYIEQLDGANRGVAPVN
ncbi:MAG: 4-hydroxy-3-methylbut-2-enyl diphosphate reductase [Planctomycetota bacterium]